MRTNAISFVTVSWSSLILFLSTSALGEQVIMGPAEYLHQLGHSTDTVQEILAATKSDSYFVRHQALEVLTERIGKEAIPTLKLFLADPHVRVRSRSAHLLGVFGDKSGIDQMRRDFKAFAPPNGASQPPEPNDPNATETAVKEGRGGKNDRLREALVVAQVLAELGDYNGYQLAAKAVFEGQLNVVRTQAICVLVEIAKTDQGILSKKGIDPVPVLCEVAASERQPVPFGVLINIAQKLRPEAASRILEKAKDSARQPELHRQIAEIALAKVKSKESSQK